MPTPWTSRDRRREPAVNLPGVVLALIAAILAIQACREFVPDASDLRLLLDFGFFPAQWSIVFGRAGPDEVVRAASLEAENPDAALMLTALARYVARESEPHPWSWLTYAFLHGSWMHVGLNSVWLAAFGAPVARRAGIWRTLALGVATALAGAAAQWLVTPLGVRPMIGASAVVSGLMAAAATFIFRPHPSGGGEAAGGTGGYGFLTNRNALLFLVAWFATNFLFGVAAGPLGLVEGSIAWEAHIGGLLAGLVLFPLLDPARSRGRGPATRA